jgi:predicted ATPase
VEFVAETLRFPPAECALLVETLYRKTGDNPFSLGQLLKLIHEERVSGDRAGEQLPRLAVGSRPEPANTR